MQNITKKTASIIALFSLLSPFACINAKDKLVPININSFLDLDDLFEEMRQQIFSYGPSKEERKAIKNSRKQLSKITPKIEQKNGQVIVEIPIENINKQAINIQIEDGILNTVIPTENGKVQISIDSNSLEVARRIEIKKESTETGPQDRTKHDKTKQDKLKQEKTESAVYFGSMATLVERLPFTVDVNTAKASTKDNLLTITLDKKQHTKVKIEHQKA